MSIKYWLACAVWLPVAAVAQTSVQVPAPGDAHVAVAAPQYESAFKDYRAATEEMETPDVAWRSLNDTARELGGHAGHIKGSVNAAMPANHQHH